MFDRDDRNQAEYVFKRFAHLLGNGVDKVFWHVLTWPYPYEVDKVQATALIDYDGVRATGAIRLCGRHARTGGREILSADGSPTATLISSRFRKSRELS